MITQANVWALLKDKANQGVHDIFGSGAPVSGTAGTGLSICGNGSKYLDINSKVTYYNEGNATNPYWTPEGYVGHPNLQAWFTDFRDGVGKAHADTAATVFLPGSGIRVHGQGIAETDSGLVVTFEEGGAVGTLTTTDEDAHLVALSCGASNSSPLPLQPDTHGPMVVEATVRMDTALTVRRFFMGFLGTCADALDPPATGATVTITLVQDDLAGLFFDAGLTAATLLCAIHNKSDEAATQTVSATTTGTVFPAAATHVRLRVEISEAGTMYCFVNRILVATVPLALDVDEEVAPVLLVGSTSAAVKAMGVRRFAAWAKRA